MAKAESRNNDLDDDENESFLLKLVVPHADEATPSKEETVVAINNTAGVENFMFGLNVKNVVVDVAWKMIMFQSNAFTEAKNDKLV